MAAGEQGLAKNVEGNKESLLVYITDGIGRLCNFDTGKEDDAGEIKTQALKAGADTKSISENAKLYFPPKRAILYNLLSSGYEGWVSSLRNTLKQIEKWLDVQCGIAELPGGVSLLM